MRMWAIAVLLGSSGGPGWDGLGESMSDSCKHEKIDGLKWRTAIYKVPQMLIHAEMEVGC